MAVDSELWWSVMWPWVVAWVLLVVSAVVLVALFVSARRYKVRRMPPPITFGIPLYLDKDQVLGVYQAGGYGKALAREIEVRESHNWTGWLTAQLRGLFGGFKGERGYEKVQRYVDKADEISVIGALWRALETESAIVHVNLAELTMVTNVALDRVLAAEPEDAPLGLHRLGIDVFVSVKGQFRVEAEADGRVVLLAGYGERDPGDLVEVPRVRVECRSASMLGDIQQEFEARCVGKVQTGRMRDGEMAFHPIAIFK